MRGWLCTPASRPQLQKETRVTYQQGQCLCLGTTRTIPFLLANLFCLFLCRDGEEVTFVSERDGNLELYQQQLSKERRSVGEEAAEGDPEASVQHRAAPKRLTYAVSMQVSLLCSGVYLSWTWDQQPSSVNAMAMLRTLCLARHGPAGPQWESNEVCIKVSKSLQRMDMLMIAALHGCFGPQDRPVPLADGCLLFVSTQTPAQRPRQSWAAVYHFNATTGAACWAIQCC